MANTLTGHHRMDDAIRRNIFVVGMPRSGTTWLAKIFDSHPSTLYRHEPDSASRLKSLPLVEPEKSDDGIDREARAEIADILQLRMPRVSGRLPIFRKDFRSAFGNLVVRNFALASKVLSRVGLDVDIPDMISGGDVRILWKSIESVSRIGMIGRLFPDSRIIHIVRHPCGHLASVERGLDEGRFVNNEAGVVDDDYFRILLDLDTARRRGLSTADLEGMSALEFYTWRWLLITEYALEAVAQLDNAMTIRYEDLCVDPMKVTREMFDFAGLGVGPQTESFIGESTSKAGDASYFSVYRDPLKAATKWKDQMRPESIELILNMVDKSPAGALFGDISGPRPGSEGAGTEAALA